MHAPTSPSDTRERDMAAIRACLQGNQAAFRELFERYHQSVYRLVYRYLRSEQDALDVTQEVFIKTYHSLASFEGRSSFYTWLRQISVNKAIDFARSRKKREVSLDESLTPASKRGSDVSPHGRLQSKELDNALSEALAGISEKHRKVFCLFTFDGLAYKDIASELDISIGTVMSRLYYARKKLQAKLGSFLDAGAVLRGSTHEG